MSNILYLLNQIDAASGNAKDAKLAGFLQHNSQHADELRRYITAVLDPSVTYGQKGVLMWNGGARDWDEAAYALLDALSATREARTRALSGNAAKEALRTFCSNYNADAVTLMNRALDKDLRCGVGVKTINALDIPDYHIPVFTCALAKDFEKKRIKPGSRWLGSIKFDGMRALAVVRDAQVNFFSRSGNPVKPLYHLAPQVLEVFGGHHVVVDMEGIGTEFLDSIQQLRRSVNIESLKSTTILQCFDIIPFHLFNDSRGGSEVGAPLAERLEELETYFQRSTPENVKELDHYDFGDDAQAMLNAADEWMEQQYEGGVFKNAASLYSKKRSADWLKVKGEDQDTLEINAVYEGEKGKQFEGSLGGVIVTKNGVPSNVGGGWTVEQRAMVWAAHSGQPVKWSKVVDGEITEFVAQPDPQNLVIGRLIDVESNGMMPSGALRHARMKRFRDMDDSKGEIA